MSSSSRPYRARMRGICTAFIVAGAAFATPAVAQTETSSSPLDGIAPHINAVLYDPEVVQQIQAWGLTTADVQHDIDAMPVAQRARLAYLLTRRWNTTDSHGRAQLQAQFLVMMSLMRESTLFASIVSSNGARLLR